MRGNTHVLGPPANGQLTPPRYAEFVMDVPEQAGPGVLKRRERMRRTATNDHRPKASLPVVPFAAAVVAAMALLAPPDLEPSWRRGNPGLCPWLTRYGQTPGETRNGRTKSCGRKGVG